MSVRKQQILTLIQQLASLDQDNIWAGKENMEYFKLAHRYGETVSLLDELSFFQDVSRAHIKFGDAAKDVLLLRFSMCLMIYDGSFMSYGVVEGKEGNSRLLEPELHVIVQLAKRILSFSEDLIVPEIES